MKILTFDIEDWFHLLDLAQTKSEKQWNGFSSRVEQGTDLILALLERNNTKASFFILGWVAEKHPNIPKKILAAGHHIGTHSHMHQLAYEQSPSQFNEDLNRSIAVLEQSTGQKIEAYRAPGFSLMNANKWVFEALISHGIKIDCSVFPAKRAHGGFSEFGNARPCLVNYNGQLIREFPINLKFNKLVFSGGGYFRFFPSFILDHWLEQSDYCMTYFHPRDFDVNQPIVPNLSALRRFKSYYGIDGAEKKLDNWLNMHKWLALDEADTQILWDKADQVFL